MLTPAGVTISPQRPTDNFGEPAWTPLAHITNAVVALNSPAAVVSESGKAYTQDGSVFVPRGSDLASGDRFTHQGKTYGVVGDAQWDMNHPFTGDDFGYVEYSIRLGG